MEPDFSGWATRPNIRCSDGRTISPDAFAHNAGSTVPLVWQHGHNSAQNVLGHATLESRDGGLYARGFFNETDSAAHARALVQHGDVVALSIYANRLQERSGTVLHGEVREVSLVLSGANPGALIDHVNLAHADGTTQVLDDEAVIYSGEALEHSGEAVAPTEELAHAGGATIAEVYDTLNPEQKDLLHFMIGAAAEDASGASAQHSDDSDEEDTLAHKEGNNVPTNVFEGSSTAPDSGPALTHSQLETIITNARRSGSFREAVLQHATTYGIDNIELLFPDAKNVMDSPEIIARKQEWVSSVLGGASKMPFARWKSMSADLTQETARALGYDTKGALKKEQFYSIAKRDTSPTTFYTKQKLDRDDIIDITDMNVVNWLWAQMRMMLDEELARAILIGDGREVDDADKINEERIRPIAFDDDFYTHKVVIPANTVGDAIVEAILRARPNYRGVGNPDLYLTEDLLTDLLLVKDKMGRRLYPTQAELTSALRVSRIITVPLMESTQTNGGDLIAILVNMSDYKIGTDRGGEIAKFEDFDIDYNQYKYLLEGRCSGGLAKFKTALTISRANGTLVTNLTAPTFVASTGVVTLPAITGVVWSQDGVTKTAGAQTAVAAGVTTEIVATPASGYYFPHNIDTDWEFTRNA